MKFKSLLHLLNHFKDNETCIKYMEQQRWNGKPVCPKCNHDKVYVTNRGYKCAGCLKKFSVTVGTVFENSKIKLNLWFAAVYFVTAHKKGVSSLQLASDLGVTQKTAWFMLHRIREMMREINPNVLTGVVEIDESFLGGKEKNKHKNKKTKCTQGGSGKEIVMGLLERGGKISVQQVENREAATLLPIIESQVEEGATISTDELSAYKQISDKYNHITVNHSEKEYVNGLAHSNGIENFWGLLKRGIIGIYHYASPKHLSRYCDEFSYRYNTRNINDTSRFTLSLGKSEGRLTYKRLIQK